MLIFDTLESIGLTTRILQIILLLFIAFSIVAFVSYVIGMIWKYLLIGFGILFCVVVLAMPSTSTLNSTKQNTIEMVKPEDKAPDEFLEDCQHYNETSKSECEQMWKERS